LSGFENKSRRFLKLEDHSAFRNFNSIQEPRLVANYGGFLSSHHVAYGWYPSFCHWANNARWSADQ
jgi:hypothetical protein